MKNKRIKIITSLFFMIIILVIVYHKRDEENKPNINTNIETITISGSTSVGSLIQKQTDEFKKENIEANVDINQSNSSLGIKDVISGTSEIGISSRDLKEEELLEDLVEVEIAFDGIALITNKNNKVNSLKINQIKDIYTGKITNWEEVGGKNSKIIVVSREDGSGTRNAFQKILGYKSEELCKEAIISYCSKDIKTKVAENEYSIGFISFEYLDDSVNALKIDDISAIAENIKSGEYKLSRPLLLVYKEENLKESANKLINFILSKEGQKIVEESGLIKIN